MSSTLYSQIISSQDRLQNHDVYRGIVDQETLRIFMENHVYAVWDFMTLLKALQLKITSMSIPWRPSLYDKKLVRIINQLVYAEESDIDHLNLPKDHFTIYCNAMAEVGADLNKMMYFMTSLDFSLLTPAQRNFVQYHVNLAKKGSVYEIAGAFFFGREKLIPLIFTRFLEALEQPGPNQKKMSEEYPSLLYYFNRHVEVDGNEHQHLAEEVMKLLCTNSQDQEAAYLAGLQSLQLRQDLWDSTFLEIQNNK